MSIAAITNTVKAAAESEGGGGSDSGWIMHHVLDENVFALPPFGKIPLPRIELFGLDISITKHVIWIWLASILLIFTFTLVAKAYKRSMVPSNSLVNLFEVFIVFVRDDIAKETIGEGYQKFTTFLLTVFFFILYCNLLGLIPYGSTATGNIAVTATLAVISFSVIQGAGIFKNGFIGYFKGLMPHGIPFWVTPIMFVVEFLGLFTKAFALAIRLFANMTAGHVVIFSIIGLIFIFNSYFIAPVSLGFSIFLYFLEILVALIQAYIFTILSALFIGMAMHQEH